MPGRARLFAGLSAFVLAIAFGQASAEPVCRGSDGYAADFGGRRVFAWSPDALAAAKAQGAGDPAYDAVLRLADTALAGPDYTVTDKTRTPPSGDRRDYMSMGPYWWPDSSKPGGEPYVRRDGQVNPERDGDAFDATDMSAVGARVEALGLAHYLTDDARYAQRAARMLRVWFLDPSTRMNPNANFAQGVPGRVTGRAEGVLDTFRLLPVIEAVGVMAPSGALTPDEIRRLKAWFGDYVDWMQSSKNGREERAARNNHGVWYDYQLASFALFAGKEDVARQVLKTAPARLASQIEPDGRMPHELARTRALHYTLFALQPAAALADIGRCVGADLWRFQTADGRSLKSAIDFVAPYAGREKDFPYPDLKAGPTSEFLELMARAADAYDDPTYAAKAALLAKALPADSARLFLPRARP